MTSERILSTWPFGFSTVAVARPRRQDGWCRARVNAWRAASLDQKGKPRRANST